MNELSYGFMNVEILLTTGMTCLPKNGTYYLGQLCWFYIF